MSYGKIDSVLPEKFRLISQTFFLFLSHVPILRVVLDFFFLLAAAAAPSSLPRPRVQFPAASPCGGVSHIIAN